MQFNAAGQTTDYAVFLQQGSQYACSMQHPCIMQYACTRYSCTHLRLQQLHQPVALPPLHPDPQLEPGGPAYSLSLCCCFISRGPPQRGRELLALHVCCDHHASLVTLLCDDHLVDVGVFDVTCLIVDLVWLWAVDGTVLTEGRYDSKATCGKLSSYIRRLSGQASLWVLTCLLGAVQSHAITCNQKVGSKYHYTEYACSTYKAARDVLSETSRLGLTLTMIMVNIPHLLCAADLDIHRQMPSSKENCPP